MSQPLESQIEAIVQYLAGLEQPEETPAAALLPAETQTQLMSALETLAEGVDGLQQENETLAAVNNELEEERTRYQRLFELAPDGYMVTDMEGVIWEANQAAALLLQRERRFLRNKPLVLFVHSDDRPLFHTHLTRLQKEGPEHLHKWELRLQPRAGQSFYAALTTVRVTNIIGQLDSLCWVVRNINQRKQAEEALREVHNELETRVNERTAELSQAVAALETEITERRHSEAEKSRLLEMLQQQHQQLRALTARLAEMQESERKQLAWELHDRVGQSLTALGLNLNLMGAYILKNLDGDSTLKIPLDDSLTLVDQTTESIRNVMAHLHPPVLDDYGLVAALRWYGHQVAARANFAVTVQGEEPEPRLPEPVEHALFRIAQEALTNATKYAQASHVILALKTDNGTACLTIRDDGIGFEVALPVEPGQHRGWGLLSMAERAEAVGGRCRIDSIPGDGTLVIVEMPR